MPLIRPRVQGSDKPAAGARIPVNTGDIDSSTLKAILGWIPVEVITAYKSGMGFIPLTYPSWRLWISILGVPITFLWIAYATRPDDKPVAWRQAIIAPLAFVLWVTAIEPAVMQNLFADWQLWMGSVLLAGGTLLLPIADGILRKMGVKQDVKQS